MTDNVWTRWPSREALSRAGVSGARRALAWSGRLAALAMLLWTTFTGGGLPTWGTALAAFGLLVCAGAVWAFFRTTLHHRLLPSVVLLVALMGLALAAYATDLRIPAVVLWCGCAVTAMERLPLAVAVPAAAAGLGAYAAVNNDAWTTTAITAVGIALAGYVLRLDAEARGSALRLLTQERAARAAEATSAAARST